MKFGLWPPQTTTTCEAFCNERLSAGRSRPPLPGLGSVSVRFGRARSATHQQRWQLCLPSHPNHASLAVKPPKNPRLSTPSPWQLGEGPLACAAGSGRVLGAARPQPRHRSHFQCARGSFAECLPTTSQASSHGSSLTQSASIKVPLFYYFFSFSFFSALFFPPPAKAPTPLPTLPASFPPLARPPPAAGEGGI